MLRILKKTCLAITVFVFLLTCENPNHHQFIADVPNPKETGAGYVSDPEQILSEAAVQHVNQRLQVLDQEGKAQVAVVLLNSIGDQVPKDFAVELFNYWKIGSETEDNGLLILVVKDQHRVEFETGYGLESVLPDIVCFEIQQNNMVGYFRSGDFETGILQGTAALIAHLEKDVSQVHVDVPQEKWSSPQNDNNNNRYEISWQDNVYTLKQNRNISFLEAWTIIRRTNDFLNLPEIPDTTQSTLQKTAQGYLHTIRIPYKFSLNNGLDVFWNSFVFIVFNALVTLIVVFAPGRGERQKYNKSKAKRSLFSNRLFFSRKFTLFFLTACPIVLLEVYLFLFQSIDAPGYVSLGIGYITWCLYAHVHYMVLLPISAASLADRHSKHEALSESYRHLKVFSFIFPLPFLRLFHFAARNQLRRLRETPYDCACGAEMKKLNEIQDNEFISAGELREEELKSIDYDIWGCVKCDRHRIFKYENFRSAVMRCNSCSHKTVKLEKREIIEHSSSNSTGYGYEHFRCRHCNEETKMKFVIAKESSSSDSLDSSSDSGSDSGSWGGGSSGGGGAGSSW